MATITGRAHSRQAIEQRIWPRLVAKQPRNHELHQLTTKALVEQRQMPIWVIQLNHQACGWLHLRHPWYCADNPRALALGYRLLPQYWGQGIASAAVKYWLQQTTLMLADSELYADTLATNAASQAVLRNNHFVPWRSFCYSADYLPALSASQRTAEIFNWRQ